MATYVMSDIHGDYDSYIKMLEMIKFSSEDTMYIIGDILDRGEHPIKVLLDVMSRPNMVFIIGNHELMFCECMKFLMQEITDESIESLDEDTADALMNWMYNGAEPTIKEFRGLSWDKRKEVKDFILESDVYEEINVAGTDYLLVHAGFDNYSPEKELWEYEIEELVWRRPDYHTDFFNGTHVIMGHTPTQLIEDAPNPGYIYYCGNNTVIDCGCSSPSGRLGCLRLDDGKEFYVEK